MSHLAEIQRRITWLQTELEALSQMVEVALDARALQNALPPEPTAPPAPVLSAPAPAPAPVRAKAAAPAPSAAPTQRWSYVPGTVYRIVKSSPFRNGNNFNLFEHLEQTYGRGEFTRQQLGEAMRALVADGAISTLQSEDMYCLSFLRIAGADKGAIEMVRTAKDA